LYIADDTHVTILNLKLEILSSWRLPTTSKTILRGLKVDEKILYLTMSNVHQIFICNSQDGKVLNKWGNVEYGSNKCEFYRPTGLTVDDKYVYICDQLNHRIQILTKDKGIFFTQWGSGKEGTDQGQFNAPYSIYNHLSEEIFYIGDVCSVQMFTKEGICIQRLGDKEYGNKRNQFNYVDGLCLINDRLYVSDTNNQRIQIFKRK